MIRGHRPDEWSRRESGPPPERFELIEEFIKALGPSAPRPKKPVRFTPQEWSHLMFLWWRVEEGLVTP